MNNYKTIVIGVSAGGLDVLMYIFKNLKDNYPLTIIVVQHLYSNSNSELAEIISLNTGMKVKEINGNEELQSGTIYTAPPDYHILAERDKTVSLYYDEKVNYSRPSIDVLFESAAYVWGKELVGIILTGSSEDGAKGIQTIKKYGGFTIAENPETAEYPFMPASAIKTGCVDKILSKKEIKKFLENLSIKEQETL